MRVSPTSCTFNFVPELPPEIETQIRSWRIEKVDIANEIGKLQKQKQGVNAQLKANMPPRLKLVLEGRIEQYNATIESKREQMAELDKKLSQYNRLWINYRIIVILLKSLSILPNGQLPLELLPLKPPNQFL